MKTTFLPLILCVLVALPSFGTEPIRYSSAWMKEALTSTIKVISDEKCTEQEVDNAFTFKVYFHGILRGMNLSSFITRDDHELLSPDEEFVSMDVVARSMMKFMQENQELILPDMNAYDVIFSWYMTHHSKSSDAQKVFALKYLLYAFKKTHDQK